MQHCNLHCISLAVSSLQWISKNQNYWIATEKHLWDITILVHRLRLFLSLSCLRHFRPHFLHVLENHVAMSTSKISRVKRKPQLPLIIHCILFYVNHLKSIIPMNAQTYDLVGQIQPCCYYPEIFSSACMADIVRSDNLTRELKLTSQHMNVIFQQAQCCWPWSY